MVFRDAIKKILSDNNYTQAQMSEKMGYSFQSGLGSQLKNNNMSVKVLLKLLNIVDYEIVLRPKSGTNKAERTVVVDKAGKDE